MSHDLTLVDRLRIERVVWTLDQQLYDLPSSSRVAKRREVRTNLRAAAEDVGAAAAIRRIGGSGRLAADYLDAELGEGPRHSWMMAAVVAGLVPLLLNAALSEAASAYEKGLLAAGPLTDGRFTWDGVTYLQSPLVFTVNGAQLSHSGGAWSPLAFVLWIGAAVAAGRLWRLVPTRRPSR